MIKEELRIKIKNNIKDFDLEVSELVKDYIKGCNIGIYYPIKYELKIDKLYAYLRDNDYNIYYPYMKKVNDDYILEYHSVKNIRTDDYNIMSSDGENIDIEFLDTIIVPGLAYNKSGYRLGRGKGCYDKALKDYNGNIIGICYDEAVIDDHFEEDFDIKAKYIITEKQVIKVEE